MRKLTPSLLLVILFIGGLTLPARAQGAARVELYDLQTGSFPTMTATLDVFDAAGGFVTGLNAGQISVLEDEQSRPLDSLQELQPGAGFVIAFNPGPVFANRDANGVSRCDKLLAALHDWALARPALLSDDVSLVTTDGLTSLHMMESRVFLNTLVAYQPQPRTITPSLGVLSQALDIVAGPAAQSGAKRAILFVTPLPDSDMLATLQSLTARAVQLGIHVYVWMVAPKDFFFTSGATALKDLAIQTGGLAFAFSGVENLPDLETYLAPLRHTYTLTYTSGIHTPGSHKLAIQVAVNGQTLVSSPVSFDMNVQPPNPILVSLPEQITRQSVEALTSGALMFAPSNHVVEIIIEFPDNHPRPLVRTILYVDGKIAAVNTTAPYDKFTWNLGGFTSSGQHNLQVEAVDILGLSKVSLGVPVTVTVIQPQRGLQVFLMHNQLWIAGGAVLLAGAALALILVVGSRSRRVSGAARRQERRKSLDPVTQPILPRTEKRAAALPWAQRGKSAPAYLVRLKGDGQPVTAPPILLTGSEMTFGASPTQATHVLDDPSISPLHARLRREQDGEFYLQDQHSTAGTWVNYDALTETSPRRLQHGDIIHMGQLAYRFLLNKHPEKPKPRIIQT